jgi:hypothetical protein
MEREALINDFAIRSFRNQADEDYISARMACRAALIGPFLWLSQQTIEKYLKCILLLNRIRAKDVNHDLSAAQDAINSSGKLTLDLSARTQHFIERVDAYGQYRYLEVSQIAAGVDMINLDGAAWELRRYCTLDEALRKITIRRGVPPPMVRLPGGYLESIIDDLENPARKPLLWRNAFFGRRGRVRIGYYPWIKAITAPLYLHPEILDDVEEYVHLQKGIKAGYRAHKAP